MGAAWVLLAGAGGMVVRARRILVDRRGGSGPGLAAAAAVCAGGGGGEGSVVVSDAGLVDAVSADATQNPMSRRRNEHVLNYEEEMNEWQLPAINSSSLKSALR